MGIITERTAAVGKMCSSCGKPVSNSDNFCPSCRSPLGQSPTRTAGPFLVKVVTGILLAFSIIAAFYVLVSPVAPEPKGDTGTKSSAASSEPFNIKANNDLGIPLGTGVAEFSKTHEAFFRSHCTPDDDGSILCMVYDPSKNLSVGTVPVAWYYFVFYEKRIVEVHYFLKGENSDLLSALIDKFGDGEILKTERIWKNSVSTMHFQWSLTDFSRSDLEMSLTKESDEWNKKSNTAFRAKAKKDL